jgi:hypothetical protein
MTPGMTLTEVRQLLTELDIRPNKALGQNFLIDGGRTMPRLDGDGLAG